MGLRWTGGIFDLEDSAIYAACGQSELLRSIDRDFDFHGVAQYQPDKLLVHTLNNLLDQYQYAPAVLSQSGYFLLNDSTSAVLDADDFPVERNTPGSTDWYFFCYGLDYKQALRDFILLSGRAPLPARHTFGLMSCRWPGYSETEARELIERYQHEGIPLSTIIIDMEWHKPGWCNWDWEPAMYPDPPAFFELGAPARRAGQFERAPAAHRLRRFPFPTIRRRDAGWAATETVYQRYQR